MVILLNVLIALYNSAYEDITGNADDEYMALFAQKTMQFVYATPISIRSCTKLTVIQPRT